MSVPLPLRRSTAAALAALAALLAPCAPPQRGAEALAAPGEEAVSPPRVVFFGSSTTAGSGASRPERRWSTTLSRRLGWIEVNRGLSSSTLTNLGRKTPSGEERWREALAGVPADVVIVMYGANDVLARVPLGDPATPGTFRHAATTVLRGIRETLPRATLVVLTPQPNRATAGAREPYDLALAEAAAAAGAVFLTAGSAFTEERLESLARDRLHLNDAGHAAVAAFLLERRGLFATAPAAARLAGGRPAAR